MKETIDARIGLCFSRDRRFLGLVDRTQKFARLVSDWYRLISIGVSIGTMTDI